MFADMNQEREAPANAEKKGTPYDTLPTFGNKKPSRFWHQISRDVRVFLVIAACIVFYFALLRMTNISAVFAKIYQVLKPIVYGLVIAYLLNPIVVLVDSHFAPWMEKRFPRLKNARQISRGTGILVAILVMAALIVALCNMMIPELYRSVRDMILTVPSQLNLFITKATEVMSEEQSTIGQMTEAVLKEASDALQTWMRTDLLNQINVLMSNLTVGVINVFKEFFYVLIGVIVSAYVLFSKEKFASQCKKLTYAVMRPSRANLFLHLCIKSNDIFGGFIIGKIIDSAIIGVLCFLGLSVLDMPYTMLVSVVVGVTNVIPFFGPYIGAIPSAILILLSDPKMGIYFIVFVFLLQQLDGNIIGPKILGDSTGLSAFWVMFSILFGGGMFGVVGMILGVPTFAVIYYIAKILVNHQLEKHTLPTDTEAYDSASYVNNDGRYVNQEKEPEKKEEKGE